jgi:ribosomal protein S18 acetylase RimI-like enzyme
MKKFITKFIKRLVYIEKIYIYSVNLKKTLGSPSLNTKIQFKEASLDDVKWINNNNEMDLKVYQWEYLKKKVESGIWKCIAVKYNNEIVGYGFYSNSEMIFKGTKKIAFELPKNSVYLFRFFVHTNYRNKSIGKNLSKFGSNIIQSNGASYGFSAIQSSNKIQIRNVEKLGRIKIGTVIFIKTKISNWAFVSIGIRKNRLKRIKL